MNEADLLSLLESDLDMLDPPDERVKQLQHLLKAAGEMITREGILLSDSVEDSQLIIMYAAYLYRKRASEDSAMPRMLRYALNNRLFAQKAGENNASE
jgi:hypothetical protein